MTPAAPTEIGVLLDEDLDVRLREPLAGRLAPDGYLVRTVRDMGWLGVKNGPLLDSMAEAGLKVLLTADVHLYRPRSAVLRRLGIGTVVVHGADHVLGNETRLDQVAAAVRRVGTGELVEVPVVST
jgi:hypothetical protein